MQVSNQSAGSLCSAVAIATAASSPEEEHKQQLSFRVYENPEALKGLEQSAEELLAAYPGASIFSSWDWLISWWESFHNHQQLEVVTGFDSAAGLVGMAALYLFKEHFSRFLSLRCLRFVGDGSGDSDNLDFVVRPGFEAAFAKTFLEYLDQQRDRWDIVRLNTLPTDSSVANQIEQLLSNAQWTSFKSGRECCSIFLPSTWEQYLATLSSEERNNIHRYRRRLERRYAVRIYRCSHEHQLPTCLDALFRLHQLRWQERGEQGTFASPERRPFYKRLSTRLLTKNRLEFWILELNGQIAAAQFAMRYRDKVYQLQEGYDPEHSSNRVGMILRAEALKQLISDGVRTYDFLAGSDKYKERWGVTKGSYRDITIAKAYSLGAVVISSIYYTKMFKEWLRLHLPPAMWGILHRIKGMTTNVSGS
jgi:CelD/BcsL family acetyltransferase involved in cellulose biosynthesis